MAIRKAPGVLAVEVDYQAQQAIIGTRQGARVAQEQVLAELKNIGYRGAFSEAEGTD